jgi:hypothetical protein
VAVLGLQLHLQIVNYYSLFINKRKIKTPL